MILLSTMRNIFSGTIWLLLLYYTAATQLGDKQWQDIPGDNQETVSSEYDASDVGPYHQNGAEYTGSDISPYGNSYSNDYGGQSNNNAYGNEYGGRSTGNAYGSEYGGQSNSNSYGNDYSGQANSNGYGGQANSNGYGGSNQDYSSDLRSQGYGSNSYGQQDGNGYVTEQIHNDGYGETLNNGYGGAQLSGGYGAEPVQGGGYGGDVHSGGYSGAGYGDLGGAGYADVSGFGNGDGYGAGMPNDEWHRPVKTIVKHVVKNIAVPHAVPAPVHVPVPKYVKFFKPFAIAKPVAVPQVIPVVRHIQKPIPFFAAFPVKHTVPVPKFVGLPVQVRVPRPVFIHVPKIVPVAKKYAVPVTVNIPKPYIVPVYKHVPVPVPHKVPKVINVIKEVPHYVKKPVPVYVDEHPMGLRNAGKTHTTSSYSNHYGNSAGYNSNGAEYSNGESYGGAKAVDGPYNDAGHGYGQGHSTNSYGQQAYSSSQNSLAYNPLYNKQKLHGFKDFQILKQPKQQYPSQSHPRAHRLPAKKPEKTATTHQQQQNLANYTSNYAAGGSASVFGVNAVNQNVVQKNAGYTQGQINALNELLYQHGKNPSQAPASNNAAVATMQLPIESVNSQFSQPVYNPNAYSDFAVNQQNNYNHSYSQPYNGENAIQPEPSEIKTRGMLAQDSKPHYYNQHPSNAYSIGYSSNRQIGGLNNIPQTAALANFGTPKQQHLGNDNYGFPNTFSDNKNLGGFSDGNLKSASPFQENQGKQSYWPSSNNQNPNYNAEPQIPQFNQQTTTQAEPQIATGNQGLNYNPPEHDFNRNNAQQGTYQSSPYRNNENQDNYVPSGSSSSSNSFSASISPPLQEFQNDALSSNIMKQNEKFDQSSSQNSYVSEQNIALPGDFTNSGSSASESESYSGSAYPSNFGNMNMENFAHAASQFINSMGNQINSPNPFNQQNPFNVLNQLNNMMQHNGQSNFNAQEQRNQFGMPSQFNDPKQYAVPNQFDDPKQYAVPNQFDDPKQYAVPNQFNDPKQYDIPNQFNDPKQYNIPNQFNDPKQYDIPNQFNDPKQYNPNQFNDPKQYSNPNQFTDSKLYNIPSEFSEPKQFGIPNQFNDPKQYDPNQFDEPKQQFNMPNQFNDPKLYNPKEFNDPKQFSTQQDFSPLQQFSGSNQFSDKNQFSPPNPYFDQNQFNDQNQFSIPSQFNNPNQFGPSSETDTTSQFNVPNQFNGKKYYINAQPSSQNQFNDQSFASQPQQASDVQNTFANHMSASKSKYVSSGSSTSSSSSSVSSSSDSSSSVIPEKRTTNPSKSEPSPSKVRSQQQASFSTNTPVTAKPPSYSTSLAYSYANKKNNQQKNNSKANVPSSEKSTESSSKDKNNADDSKTQTPVDSKFSVQYSPAVQSSESQLAKDMQDEMEKHIQSSASSIINVYTNSPQSLGGKRGHPFSFMDPTALGSSQSAVFYQPQDPDDSAKIQYNSEDLKVVAGPAYLQDPAEPLQTSLDAYVPINNEYRRSSDQTIVYKEAVSDSNGYKEAITLNGDSDSSQS